MMFLLKTAFWLGLVLVLLPTGSNKQANDEPQINAAEAATAATGALADLSQFCTRRPDTCTVGSQVASVLARRAQDGAVMVYEFIADRRQGEPAKIKALPAKTTTGDQALNDTTGSIGGMPTDGVMIPRPRPKQGEDTLTATDRLPAWRKPALRQAAQIGRAG